MRTLTKVLAVALAVVACAFAATAFASQASPGPATQGPTFTMNPTSGPAGAGIDLRGYHFGAKGVQGTLTFNGQAIPQGYFLVESNHTWNALIHVPAGTAPGQYQVVATAGDLTASQTFTVTSG